MDEALEMSPHLSALLAQTILRCCESPSYDTTCPDQCHSLWNNMWQEALMEFVTDSGGRTLHLRTYSYLALRSVCLL